MRGKASRSRRFCSLTGITPAYAGKSTRKLSRLLIFSDHPRLCGEKLGRIIKITLDVGSPPPMRGKVRNAVYGVFVFRITPAYAGKSSFTNFSNFIFQDHPRLCGEKMVVKASKQLKPGSPPPMRGKGKAIGSYFARNRITPAYAGKRGTYSNSKGGTRDHPRLCGEKSQIPLKNSPIPGSPPPMRGKGV